jgi:hypothetical protein
MWASLDELLHQILMIGQNLSWKEIFNKLTWLVAQEDFINIQFVSMFPNGATYFV